jgi:cell division protease FtsH
MLLLLALVLTLNWVVVLALAPKTTTRVSVPYSVFSRQLDAGNVASVSAKGSAIQGVFRRAVIFPPGKDAVTSKSFSTQRPTFADDNLLDALLRQGAVVSAKPVSSGQSTFVTILVGFVPTILLVAFFVWMMRRAAGGVGGGGMFGGIGRSQAKKYQADEQRTTFDDVATDELAEVVDFLKPRSRLRSSWR